jgi:S1-C subfamily serine protease
MASLAHTGAMSTLTTELSGLSQAMMDLVEKTVTGVVAVKSAPYRVVSGVSLRENLIAVADHTLRRQDRVPVQTAAGAEGVATILGRDPGVDLAFLKVENVTLTPLSARDAGSLKAGALAAAVGLTIDVGPSASLGVIGAVGPSRRTWRGGTLDQFIRLDVNIYPSQSGAAVVDSEGALIGLATPGLLRHSALAVPVATLNRVARELLEQGRIRKGYLGVGLQPVLIPASLREKAELTQESGLIVLSVEPDSPAEQAGLQLGDILLALGDTPLADVEELQTALRGDAVGQTVSILLLRGGEKAPARLTISERSRKAN